MRFGYTLAHSTARQAFDDAYGVYDKLASAGADGTPEYVAACDAEAAALDALIALPSTTPMELKEKLAILDGRAAWAWEKWEDILAQIQRDLINMARPNVSPRVAEAFAAWAEAHRAHCQDTIGEDEHDDALCLATGDAVEALMLVDCTTPGDLIVKLYVEMMGALGPKAKEGRIWPFLPDQGAIGQNRDGRCEVAADRAFFRDIAESDLGCCLFALGRVDFDPEAWIGQCRRAGKSVSLIVIPDASDERGYRRSLSFGMDGEGPLADILQRLTANGLQEVSIARCHAIADAIEASHPDLLYVHVSEAEDEQPAAEAAE